MAELRAYLDLAEDEGNAWGRLAEALTALGRVDEAADAYLTGIDQSAQARPHRHGHPTSRPPSRPVTAAAVATRRVLPRAARLRMWQRNATIGRKTVAVTLTPRFLEAIAYLAIMGLGLGTVPDDGGRRGLRRLHRARASRRRR